MTSTSYFIELNAEQRVVGKVARTDNDPPPTDGAPVVVAAAQPPAPPAGMIEVDETTYMAASLNSVYGTDGTFRAEPSAPIGMSLLSFMQLFTQEERIAMRSLAATDPAVNDWLAMLHLDPNVSMLSPSTAKGLQDLVAAGVISASRLDSIMAGQRPTA